jgi:hypothetical protein
MRFRLALASIFVLVSRATFANAIIFTASDEGAMNYGLLQATDIGPPDFFGLSVTRDGEQRLFSAVGSIFSGESGPLLSLTLTRDASGAVVQSRYEYDGGIFDMHFEVEDLATGEHAIGEFVAPIIGLMTVIVNERDEPRGDSATVSYRLGAGLFDASVAKLLGVRQHTIGGFVTDPHLAFGTGDYTSLHGRLDEGAAMVEIYVPEPASLLLFVASGVVVFVRRQLTKRSDSTS